MADTPKTTRHSVIPAKAGISGNKRDLSQWLEIPAFAGMMFLPNPPPLSLPGMSGQSRGLGEISLVTLDHPDKPGDDRRCLFGKDHYDTSTNSRKNLKNKLVVTPPGSTNEMSSPRIISQKKFLNSKKFQQRTD